MADVEVIPAPYVITENDKRGLVVVIAATTLSFVWTCLLIRIWLRLKPREWKLDDYFLVASTILDTVVAALVFRAVNAGLGRALEDLNGVEDLIRIGKDDLGIQVVYIITLLLSKCGVLFLYLRLSPRKGHTIASWATMAISVAWAIAAVVLIALPCKASEYWPNGIEQCSNIAARWRAISAIDIITEGVIFLISIYLVAKLNMKFKSKVVVVAAFSLRLPVIVGSATRLYYFENFLSSSDHSLQGAYYMVATLSHLGYAIMSSTLTGLGPFLRPFSQTSFNTSSYPSGGSGLTKSNPGNTRDENYAEQATSYQMTPLSAHPKPSRSLKLTHGGSTPALSHTQSHHELNLRPERDLVKQDTAVLGGGDSVDTEDAVSRVSDDSQRMIITKKTEFTMEMGNTSFLRDPSMDGGREYTRKSVLVQTRGRSFDGPR